MAKTIWHRLLTKSIPLPLKRLMICPMPKVTLEMMIGRPDIILCDSRKQEATEDQFLQESYTEHARDPADSFRR